MQALVKTGTGPGLELLDVPEPPMSINDVRIRVRKTGICGTDLHIAGWDAWAERTIQPPLIVGHEFVGEVLEVGSNVRDIAPGDLVSGEGHVICGRCRHCRAGRWHLCANTIGLGVQRDGCLRRAGRPAGDERVAPLAGHRRGGRPRSSIRSATRSTPRSPSPSWARTCWSSAPGRSG